MEHGRHTEQDLRRIAEQHGVHPMYASLALCAMEHLHAAREESGKVSRAIKDLLERNKSGEQIDESEMSEMGQKLELCSAETREKKRQLNGIVTNHLRFHSDVGLGAVGHFGIAPSLYLAAGFHPNEIEELHIELLRKMYATLEGTGRMQG